ncbi:S8 family serine peptidase [Glaciecola sp. 2405UD65-10]|uniref:S8 family serine peptidase n=1 Tax=Glaciecola sp. 2405UD65-10 TaxID=3397244 RepID=UPI003B5C40BE
MGLVNGSGTGLHDLGVQGEDVIVGILDTGVTPEHPSYADDGSYSDPTTIGWTAEDACDEGEEAAEGTFSCNNKLIGARYYGDSFSSVYDIRYDLGEFDSPRDADGHGNHTATTSAGNADVTATLSGVEIGTVSGVAPRARVAMYKVCWNSNYVSDEGVEERGCFFGDSMAAIDQAVIDGVDVINYSIGNSANLNTPVYNASLAAAEAGVFFAGSSGNSGPDASTASNIAPWITTVGASTYDGIVPLVGVATELSIDGEAQEPLFSIDGGITPASPEGFTGQLVAIQPSLACDADGPVTNPDEIEGNVALIARGTCNFSEKILNAQNAGATGVLVYSDTRSPIAMGGDGTGITIPGRMITNEDGLLLASTATTSDVTVTFTSNGTTLDTFVEGNTMAEFSSRGPNTTPQDIIKPDITGPGVQILAATTPTQLDTPGNVRGETFAYLSGTSMSSPHIAGIAALIKGEHPDWTPAQIKSAMMTSARQNVTKEDGSTPADPFDFGAGHVVPLPALTPGLTYDANINDYLAFLCGQDLDSIVDGYGDGSTDCATLEAAGFATDASQLNYPSIAIAELVTTKTITRTVTNMTSDAGVYTIEVNAPLGINASVKTYDSNGVETDSDMLEVEPNGKASYAIEFSKGSGFVADEFTFGDVVLTGADGTVVRSPIAIKATADIKISVPEAVSLPLKRGRTSLPVEMLYTGRASMDYAGLELPSVFNGVAVEDPDREFDFIEGLDTAWFPYVFEGTKVLRINLVDSLVSVPGTDLDLYVYRCIAFSCSQVAQSLNAGSDEEVLLVNPEPASPADGEGAFYIIFTHAYDTAGNAEVSFTQPSWFVDSTAGTRMSMSSRAVKGRYNSVRISTSDVVPNGLYMGGITFYNDEGESEGTTIIEAVEQ